MVFYQPAHLPTLSGFETVSTTRQNHAFADANYLSRVIAHLKSARLGRGLSLGELARRAGLRNGIIIRAERDGVVPRTLEFKAWALALEISWEDVWSASFPQKAQRAND